MKLASLKNKHQRLKGFTFPEILIAVVIVTIVVAIAVPWVLTAKQDSLKAAACGTVVNLNNALTRADLKGIGGIPGLNAGPANEAANYLFGQNLVENAPAKTEELYPYIWIVENEGEPHFVCAGDGVDNPYNPNPTPTPPGGEDNGGGDPPIIALEDFYYNPLIQILSEMPYMWERDWSRSITTGLETVENYYFPEGYDPGTPPEYSIQTELRTAMTVYGDETPIGYNAYFTGWLDGVYYENELVLTMSNNDTGPMGDGDHEDSYNLTPFASLLPTNELNALLDAYQLPGTAHYHDYNHGSQSAPYEDHALSYFGMDNGMVDWYPQELWAQQENQYGAASLGDSYSYQGSYGVYDAYMQTGYVDQSLYGTTSIEGFLQAAYTAYGTAPVAIPKLVSDPSTWALTDLQDYAAFITTGGGMTYDETWNQYNFAGYDTSLYEPTYYEADAYENWLIANGSFGLGGGGSVTIGDQQPTGFAYAVNQDQWAETYGAESWDDYYNNVVGGPAGQEEYAYYQGYASWEQFKAAEIDSEIMDTEAEQKIWLANYINSSHAAAAQVGYSTNGASTGTNMWEYGAWNNVLSGDMPSIPPTGNVYDMVAMRQLNNVYAQTDPTSEPYWTFSSEFQTFIADPNLSTSAAANVIKVLAAQSGGTTWPDFTDYGNPVLPKLAEAQTHKTYFTSDGQWMGGETTGGPTDADWDAYNVWYENERSAREASLNNSIITLLNAHPEAAVGLHIQDWYGVQFTPQQLAQLSPEARANLAYQE